MTISLPKPEKILLVKLLQEIVRKCDLDALALVTKTGFKIEFYSHIDIEPDIFSSLAATMDGTGSLVSSKMATGDLTEIIVWGSQGYTIMKPVSQNYILIGASRESFSLGKTRLILAEYGDQLPKKLKFISSLTSLHACDHYCEKEELECCNCANRIEKCSICKQENNIQI